VQSARDLFQFAVGLIVLSDLDERRVPDGLLLREAFSLTPAEIRIAQALANGLRLPAVAERMRVSHETVRSQLKSIFHKTGAGHQGELVVILDRMAGGSGTATHVQGASANRALRLK
jgi:DNA-binding CsgD family transcriptional regulator